MTKARLQRIKQVLQHRQDDICVVLDETHKVHNLSAIMRTCDAVGVPAMHAVETNDQAMRTYRATAQGSQCWVSLYIHEKTQKKALINMVKSQGKKILAAHFSNTAVDFTTIDFSQPFALVMGAEKHGVSHEMAQLADAHIIVPMHGMVASLSVSVACAIILYEMQRQRRYKKMYDNNKKLCPQKVFEWAQPKVAQWCKENNIAYPALDEAGDIVNAEKLDG